MAFWMVETIITSDEVLTHYDLDLPLCFPTLPSLNGLEECLRHIMPDERRTNRLNTSGSLCPSEKVKLLTKREGSSGYYLLRKAIALFIYKKIRLFTTREPLIAMCGPHKRIAGTTAVRLQRCTFPLDGYNYDRSTRKHRNADGLWRLPVMFENDPRIRKLKCICFMLVS